MEYGSPYPKLVSGRVWHLLHVWAEWRTNKGVARSLPMPEECGRNVKRGDVWAFERVGAVMEPHTTRPPEPGTLDVFNQVMMDLPKIFQVYLAAAVERQGEPWLTGKSWREWMKTRKLKPRGLRSRMKKAVVGLQEAARKRGVG